MTTSTTVLPPAALFDATPYATGATAGLVTSPITSRLFHAKPSAQVKGLKGQKPAPKRGYGFPAGDLLRHIRDEFGPEVRPGQDPAACVDQAVAAKVLRTALMAPNRAVAASWNGAELIEWTLYLGPGTARIGSHDPVARERRALREVANRDAKVAELLRVNQFREAVAEVWEMWDEGVHVTPEALAEAWIDAAGYDCRELPPAEQPEVQDPEAEAAAVKARRADAALLMHDWCLKVLDTAAEHYDTRMLPEAPQVVRGTIFGLSAKARRRMIYTLGSVDYTPMFKQAGRNAVPMQTLTYGDAWLAACPDGRTYHDHQKTLWRRHEQAWGKETTNPDTGKRVWVPAGVIGIWKLEFQRRGAPHSHIFMPEQRGTARVPRRGIRPVGAGLEYKQWLSAVWNHIVYGTAPCADWLATGTCQPLRVHIGEDGKPAETGCRGRHEVRQDVVERYRAHNPKATAEQAAEKIEADARKHLLAGTAVDYDESSSITDPKRMAAYFSKHGAWSAKRYQDVMPEAWAAMGPAEQAAYEDSFLANGHLAEEWIEHASTPAGAVGVDELGDGQDDAEPAPQAYASTPGTGRIWGYKGLKKDITPVRVTAAEAVELARTLRKYCRSQDSVVRFVETEKVEAKTGPLAGEMVEKVKRKGLKARSPYSKPGTSEAKQRVRKAGKHSRPRTATAAVTRHEGGMPRPVYEDVIGLSGAAYAEETPASVRKVQRRAPRFSNTGTPSGWALVHDGERIGAVLARSLGQGGGVRLGLRDGLRAAGIPAPPPMRPGPWSRSAAELRARLAPVPDLTAAAELPPPRGLRMTTRPRPEAALPPVYPGETCVYCNLPLADVLVELGAHPLCRQEAEDTAAYAAFGPNHWAN